MESLQQRARRILDRVYGELDVIVDELTADRDGQFQALPRDYRERELPTFSRAQFMLTLGILREDRQPTRVETDAARDMVIKRAQEGVPLSLVLHNWHRGFEVIWRALSRAAGEGDAEALAALTQRLFRIQDHRTRQVIDTYEAERAAIEIDRRGGRYLVARALLDGATEIAAAELSGIALAERYVVLAVRFGSESPDDGERVVATSVAGRRTTREILRAFPNLSVLPAVDASGGFVLIPADDTSDDAGVRKYVAQIASLARVTVTAAMVGPTLRADLPTARTLASDLVDLAVASGRLPGIYRLNDLLAEYHVSRPSAARDALAALLDPLRSHDDLLDTVRAYFACDLDRSRTARSLGVHPNTVNNRLNRASELLGLRLDRSSGLVQIGIALTLDRLGISRPTLGG